MQTVIRPALNGISHNSGGKWMNWQNTKCQIMKPNFKIEFHSQLDFVNRMAETSYILIYIQSITITYLSCLRELFCDFNNNMAKSFLFPKNTIPENAYHISSTQRYFPMRIWTKGFQRHFVQLHCICSLAFLPV